MPVCHQSFNFMYVFALVSSLICLQLILVSASSESNEVTRPNLSDDAIANDWKIMDSNSESDEDSQMKIRSTSFLRFGREIPSGSFLRFGRSDPSFLRFGRNGGQFLRFGRRSQAAPTSHFLRFGRKTDFLRFG